MNEKRTIHLVEIPLGGKAGFVWNRLHGEREDICEALLKDSGERREVLQTRLRKVDDALDRVMSGSYGNCSKCGHVIDDSKLEIDPALALCLVCWGRESGAMWVDERVFITSPIISVHVKHNGAAESAQDISAVLH